MRVASRAGGEESEEMDDEKQPRCFSFELYEPFPVQAVTCARSRQEFLNKL